MKEVYSVLQDKYKCRCDRRTPKIQTRRYLGFWCCKICNNILPRKHQRDYATLKYEEWSDGSLK